MLERKPLPEFMKKQQSFLENHRFLTKIAGGLVSILMLSGLLLYLSPRLGWDEKQGVAGESLSLENSVINNLSDRSTREKLATLRQIADSRSKGSTSWKKVSNLDRNRARYLLAVESLQQDRPQVALEYLAGLEKKYRVIAPYILLRQAQAYQKLQQKKDAVKIAQNIIDNYPHSSVIPEILNLLERRSDKDIAYLRSNFPYHPQTQTIARQRLRENPQDWQSLLLIATYERQEDIDQIRDRLVLEHPANLTKQDWQAIADGYWRTGEHRKAADAYRLSPPSPQNLYRTARGFHRNGNFSEAKIAYKKLINEYHDAQETGQALYYIARLSAADEAVKYLEKAIARFPLSAPQALLYKARLHEKYDKITQAKLARKQALENYPDSQAVLDYRWQKAHRLAIAGDYDGAWQWGEAIAYTKSLESDPKTMFWLGKWAKKAGKTAATERTFKNVMAIHPQSYYAWRSAVMLGLDVGDFDNLSQLQPNLNFKSHYEPLPVGSDTLQELYLLDQYQDAWIQLQSELSHPQKLTVEEQFTDGLLLVKSGKIRPGIQSIWSLGKRESLLDRQQWRSLRKRDAYWYGLFPFPYEQSLISNAKQEKINSLLPISVMRKESTFDPDIDSHVGAVGLMQIIPRTANWIAKQNNITAYDLTKPEDNIRMGTWYLAHNHQRYNNNSLYAIASYNAGTGNVNRWLKQYSLKDPDLFVERIPFPETKDYVEGVFGNYWNYLRLYDSRYQELQIKN